MINMTRVSAWKASCYFKMVVGFIWALCFLIWGLRLLSAEYLRTKWYTPLLLAAAAGLFLSLALRSIWVESLRSKSPGKSRTSMKFQKAAAWVKRWATLHHKRVPVIALGEDTRVLKFAVNAGVVDEMVGQDGLIIGEKLVEELDEPEMQAVLAHEMCHKDSFGSKLEVILGILSAAMWFLSWYALGRWFFGSLGFFAALKIVLVSTGFRAVANLGAKLLSRAAEFLCDSAALLEMGSPEPFASALHKIEALMRREYPDKVAKRERQGAIHRLFRSHPSTPSRTQALRDLCTP
jgi:Zn-dependent protease with chaperone function